MENQEHPLAKAAAREKNSSRPISAGRTAPWMILLMFFLLTGPAWTVFAGDRNPFEEPETPETLYDYKRASRRVVITGLITTDQDAKAIVATEPEAPASVYSLDSRILVSFNGVDHEFRIQKIKTRSLVLRALNGTTYEVEVK